MLSNEEIREVGKITTAVQVAKGATIFFEGDKNTYLFNVVSGAVILSKLLRDGRRQVTGFLFPGDFLGLSVSDTYAYTAEALSDTSLCRFSRTKLLKLLDHFPKLEHRLLERASNEIVEAQAQLLMLGQKDATEKVSTALIDLMKRIGQRRGDKIVIEMPITRADLAEYAGVTVETVSRCLRRLRKSGIITLPSPRSVYILQEVELRRLSGD